VLPFDTAFVADDNFVLAWIIAKGENEGGEFRSATGVPIPGPFKNFEGRREMRKILITLIALAAISPAYADTIKSTHDFGAPAFDRVAVVGFTCKSCSGAKSVSINGVELKRDATSGGAEAAEIWSAPLPEGSGPLTVTINSDHNIDDSDVIPGAVGSEPNKVSDLPTLKEAFAGEHQYSLGVTYGDTVFALSRGQGPVTGTLAPSQHDAAKFSQADSWDINHADPFFSVSGTGTVSAVAIYR